MEFVAGSKRILNFRNKRHINIFVNVPTLFKKIILTDEDRRGKKKSNKKVLHFL